MGPAISCFVLRLPSAAVLSGVPPRLATTIGVAVRCLGYSLLGESRYWCLVSTILSVESFCSAHIEKKNTLCSPSGACVFFTLGMVSTRETHDDEELQLVITQDVPLVSYSPSIRDFMYNLMSNICCFMFLSVLMILALIKYCYNTYIKVNHFKYKDSNVEAYPGMTNPRVIPDLRYYTNLIGLDLVEYRVTTKDGFILNLYRIVDLTTQLPNSEGKPILMIHGLLQSSGSFITSGIKSLAYFLFTSNSGKFDIWLGNNRCGFEPRHLYYNIDDPKMWDWDIREMAQYDIPAMIDTILKYNNRKVALVCHSQGTTQTFIGLSRQYNNCIDNSKVDKFIALAPAIFPGKLLHERLFIKFINSLPDSLYDLFFGYNSFMPIMMKLRLKLYRLPIMGVFSYAMFNFLFGWNDYLWDYELRRIHFLFSPVYVSSKLMKWWLLGNTPAKKSFNNSKLIMEESWFSDETPKILLVIGELDELVNSDLLIEHLDKYEPFYQGKYDTIKLNNYSHLDVLWSDDLIDRVGYKVLNFLNE